MLPGGAFLRQRVHARIGGQQPRPALQHLLRRRHQQLLRGLQLLPRGGGPGVAPQGLRRGGREGRQVLPDLRGDGLPGLPAGPPLPQPALHRQLGGLLQQQQRRVLADAVRRRRELQRGRLGLRAGLPEAVQAQLHAAVRRAGAGGRGRRGADAGGVAQERDEAAAREGGAAAGGAPAQVAGAGERRREDDRLRAHVVRDEDAGAGAGRGGGAAPGPRRGVPHRAGQPEAAAVADTRGRLTPGGVGEIFILLESRPAM